jgi:uncharacterized protein (TIGR03663 family)
MGTTAKGRLHDAGQPTEAFNADVRLAQRPRRPSRLKEAEAPMSKRLRWTFGLAAVLVLTVAASILGFTQLERRPVHADEAVHAIKFGEMLRPGLGQYEYDPTEYHGPTLYYTTQLVAMAYGQDTLASLESFHLRTTPVLFGIALVLLTLLIMDGLSPAGSALAAALTIATPLIGYYARDFIHETLFVFFIFLTIAAGYRYLSAAPGGWGRPLWAIAVGAGVALMWTSKETVAFVGLAMVLGVAGSWAWGRFVLGAGQSLQPAGSTSVDAAASSESQPSIRAGEPAAGVLCDRRLLIHAGLALLTLALVALVLFTSFFTNWQGIADGVLTYWYYFARGMAEGETAKIHQQPWWWYLELLAWRSHPPAPVWTNLFVLGLAAVGAVAGFIPRLAGAMDARLARFLAIYSVGLFLLYTLIPYKQPWLMMGPLHGFILLAGMGGAVLVRRAWSMPGRTAGITVMGVGLLIAAAALPYRLSMLGELGILLATALGALGLAWMTRWGPRWAAPALVGLALLVGLGHLAHQASWAHTRFVADNRNPLAHAQTSVDVRNLVRRVQQLSEHHPDGRNMVVRVVAPNPWPLPWYFRGFGRTGYWTSPPAEVDGPVIVVERGYAKAVREQLTGEYEVAFYGLRPGTRLLLYIDQSLWSAFMADRQ